MIGRKIGREPGLARPRPSVEAVDAMCIDALTCKLRRWIRQDVTSLSTLGFDESSCEGAPGCMDHQRPNSSTRSCTVFYWWAAISSVSDAASRTRACLRSFRKAFSTGTPRCDFRLVSNGLRVCVSIHTPHPSLE